MDPASGLCSGCGRTLEEIVQWATMTEDKRRSIMAGLEARVATKAQAVAAARKAQ